MFSPGALACLRTQPFHLLRVIFPAGFSAIERRILEMEPLIVIASKRYFWYNLAHAGTRYERIYLLVGPQLAAKASNTHNPQDIEKHFHCP